MAALNPSRYLPPEWAPQSGVMLTWPQEHSDWRPWFQRVQTTFVEIAKQVSQYEIVLITCADAAVVNSVRSMLKHAGAVLDRVRFHIAPSDDTWVRDHGPLTVIERGEPRLLDFTFNGWGQKFDAAQDNALTSHLYAQGVFGPATLEAVAMVLEGGSIEVDGAGGLLTTSRCLLSPERNARLGRGALEQRLSDLFGVQRVMWLEHGYLSGDDTDGHIDTLARFCSPNTIAYVHCDAPHDEHYQELKTMHEELKDMRDAAGDPYHLLALPWPAALYAEDGRRLPATYANFLIINGAVLVPMYGDPADAQALKILQSAFPDRRAIGVECSSLLQQYGSLHCVTMQLPAGVLP